MSFSETSSQHPEALPSLPAGCSSLGDLLSRSIRLGIPLRDLLRLVPVLLGSASGPQTLQGFPLQAFWSWCSVLVNWLVNSDRCSSLPYVLTASTGRTDNWFLPVTPEGVCSRWDKVLCLIASLHRSCPAAEKNCLENTDFVSFSATRKWNN